MATETRRFAKPPLIFEGESGREAFEYIINTPPPDFTELRKEVEEEKRKILMRQKNGEV